MKKQILFTGIMLCVIAITSCSEKKAPEKSANDNSQIQENNKVAGSDCNIRIGNIAFTKSINGADTLVSMDGDKITLKVGGEKDYFSDPDGKLTNNTSPVLLSKIDNTKPFTISAKVTPEFTKQGTYNAGDLFVYSNEGFWEKFCFEQSEGGEHRMVTVRNKQFSDDNNHDIVKQSFVYMKISSDTKTIACYYSLDNKKWQMVRLHKNDYPEILYVGISTQCPVDKVGSSSIFEELSLSNKSVTDFRLGK
jgi:regulation of enolase protein 1 (concanavalin A-like superfamily)